MKKFIVVIVAILAVVLAGALVLSTSGRSTLLHFFQPTDGTSEDYFIYTHHIDYEIDNDQLVYYDLKTRVSTPILTNWIVYFKFALSSDNKLAFSSNKSGNFEVYTVPYPFDDDAVVQITNDPGSTEWPVSWSPDGRYLLINSSKEEDHSHTHLIWDGKKLTEMFTETGSISPHGWDSKSRLAFEFTPRSADGILGDTEIYVWDGQETFNISQNPGRDDAVPVWSDDGRLAYFSHNDDWNGIVVWDGKTYPNNRNFLKAFSVIAAPPGFDYSNARWTKAGVLLFDVYDEASESIQVYSWNGRKVSVTDLNYKRDVAGFNPEGNEYWAAFSVPMTYSDFTIYDNNDQIVYRADRTMGAAWNDKEYLLFCDTGEGGWKLMLWDGKAVNEIIAGQGNIYSRWKNGTYTFCWAG